MEVSALKHRSAHVRGPTPLLRLQGDERLVALTRRGHQAAYEALVARYQARLLAFCRHMLPSREDAEDVLQEVFAAAFSAMMADDRPINVRPWLYRIARNRSLNHLRRQTAIGVDSMDVHFADHGSSTADRVHRREDFRQLVNDVQHLAETQRTALLLREIDALSYEQIAETMETTVPAIKSLLVRARVALAEAAEARKLTCDEVREELGEAAEGITRRSAVVRRHVRDCEPCRAFDKHLRHTNRALASLFPIGPLLLLKNVVFAQGSSAAAGAASAAGAATATATGTAGSTLVGAGLTTAITKAAAGVAAAAIVTAGAVEVDHTRDRGATTRAERGAATAPARTATTPPAPRAVATLPQRAEITRRARAAESSLATSPAAAAAALERRRAARAEARRDGRTAGAAEGDRAPKADASDASASAPEAAAAVTVGTDPATLPVVPEAAPVPPVAAVAPVAPVAVVPAPVAPAEPTPAPVAAAAEPEPAPSTATGGPSDDAAPAPALSDDPAPAPAPPSLAPTLAAPMPAETPAPAPAPTTPSPPATTPVPAS